MPPRSRNTLPRRLKYRLLSLLPGQAGLRYARKYRKLFLPQIEAQFRAALDAAAGTICIDLGANLGVHSRTMAARAARVYAFEPDPWTAARLRENLADLPNVEIVEAAAGNAGGSIRIYRTPGFEADPGTASQSTSTLADKLNVDQASAIDVAQVDFAAFLGGLDGPVGVIKMDIEGAEVALLEHLLDSGALARVGHVFVETHETRVPSLAARTQALRRRVQGMTRPVINMDWK